MRVLFLLVGIVLSLNTCACSCGYESKSLFENYQSSDFVADISIIKTSSKSNSANNQAEIKINQLFKGPSPKVIGFGGSIDGQTINSCDITLLTGTRYLVFLKKYEGEFFMSFCTKQIEISDKIPSEIVVLNHILKSKHQHSSKFSAANETIIEVDFDSSLFKGKSKIGYFELAIKEKIEVKEISGFNNEINLKLIKVLENEDWLFSRDSNSEMHFIIEIFYFGKEISVKNSIPNEFYLFNQDN